MKVLVGDASAVLGFLEAHEPDLLACSEALGVAPLDLVGAVDHVRAE